MVFRVYFLFILKLTREYYNSNNSHCPVRVFLVIGFQVYQSTKTC